MEHKIDFDSEDYTEFQAHEEIESYFKPDKRRRLYDARREIERRMEMRSLHKLLNDGDFVELE